MSWGLPKIMGGGALSLSLVGCSLLGFSPAAIPSSPPPSATPVPAVTVTVTPTPSPGWTDVLRVAAPATVRITSQDCDGGVGVGSGVFISHNQVLTAAHVVAGAETIVIQSDQFLTSGRVVRSDAGSDVALVLTDDSFSSQGLDVADYKAAQGEDVRVLGYPDAVTERWVAEGIVASNEGQLIDPDTGAVVASGLLAVTAPLNPGNSGGPVIDIKGNVIGVVSAKNFRTTDNRATEGMSFAVHAKKVRPEVEEWLDLAPKGGECGNQQATEGTPPDVVVDEDLTATQQAVVTALTLHGGAINSGDYETAWGMFTGRMQKRMGSLKGWSKGLVSSTWQEITVHSVEVNADTALAEVSLRTEQSAAAGVDGQTCSVWDNTYGLRSIGDQWLIDSSHRSDGSPAAC